MGAPPGGSPICASVNVLPRQKLPSDSGAQRKRVVMNKAFHTLVDDRTDVSVETGLRAAEKLQSVLDGHEQGTDIARMRIELGRIIDAVKSTVPQSMWGEIIEKLDQMEQAIPRVDRRRDRRLRRVG